MIDPICINTLQRFTILVPLYLLIIVFYESRMLIHAFENHIISYCIFKKCIIGENVHYEISCKVLYKKKMRDAYQV